MRRTINSTVILLLLFAHAGGQVSRHGKGRTKGETERRCAARSAESIATHEHETVQTLRVLVSAEATYQATDGYGNYGTLKQLVDFGLLAREMFNSGGVHRGYRFNIRRLESEANESLAAFEIVAMPLKYGESGCRSFFVDETGVIRAGDKRGRAAGANDRVLDDVTARRRR